MAGGTWNDFNSTAGWDYQCHITHASLKARDRGPVSSIPNPVISVNSLSCLRDSTGKLLLASKSRDGCVDVGSESCTHPVDRNTAVSDDGDRGLLHPAISLNSDKRLSLISLHSLARCVIN